MRRITIALTIILVEASLAASSRTTAQTANAAAEEQMIRQLSQQWVAAAATKDPAAVVKFYADDGVLLPQGAPLAEGHNAIAKVWRGYFDLPDFSLTFSPTKINVSSSGDMAYEIGMSGSAHNLPWPLQQPLLNETDYQAQRSGVRGRQLRRRTPHGPYSVGCLSACVRGPADHHPRVRPCRVDRRAGRKASGEKGMAQASHRAER